MAYTPVVAITGSILLSQSVYFGNYCECIEKFATVVHRNMKLVFAMEFPPVLIREALPAL